eukprot:g1877.t1
MLPAKERHPTPLPLAKIGVIMVVFLANALAYTTPLPMVPFMLQKFLELAPNEQARIGYLSGLVAAAFTVGQQVGAPLWGALSDRIGRRPVILCTMLGSTVGVVAFGLAPNLPCAMAARLVHGLFGASGVARSYMADITDETNEARAFGMIGAVWGAGGMLGPAIGGLLAQPARQYPSVFSQDGAFGDSHFPFLLPCLVIAAFTLVDFVFALVYLHDVRDGTGAGADDGTEAEAQARAEAEAEGGTKAGRRWRCPRYCGEARALVAANPSLRAALTLFFMFGTSFVAYQEVFPIWARQPLALGGAQWSSGRVGTVLGLGAIGTFFASLVVYPVLVRRWRHPQERVFKAGVLLNLAAYPWPAVLNAVPGGMATAVAVPILVVSNFLNAMGWEFCFTSANLMVKNAVPGHRIGLAMGLGTTAVAAGQGLGPVPAASLFAVSSAASGRLAGGGWPAWLRAGRLFFIVCEMLLVVNWSLIFLRLKRLEARGAAEEVAAAREV